MKLIKTQQPIRMLYMGLPGSGKTSSLESLVPNFKLRIVDFDRGASALAHRLKDQPTDIQTYDYSDDYVVVGKEIMPKGRPMAFEKFIRSFEDGFDGEFPKKDWGPDHVLILDTVSNMCKHSLTDHVVSQRPAQGKMAPNDLMLRDYMTFDKKLGALWQFLMSEWVQFHVIVLAHIDYREHGPEGSGVTHGLPKLVGKVPPSAMGGYFTSQILAYADGGRHSTRREIRTTTTEFVQTKMPYPGIEKSLPLETGLKTIFNAAGFTGVKTHGRN